MPVLLGEEKRPSPCFQPQELTVTQAQTDTQVMIAQCEALGMGEEEEGHTEWECSLSI